MGLSVLVTGMHRSGTSAVAQVVQAAGFSGGDPDAFMVASYDNPEGYGERRDVMDFNDRMLRSLGWTWDAPAAEPLASPPTLASFLDEGRRFVEERLAPHAPWFVKDPRLALLMPWWRKILLDRFITVLATRSAAEVVWSLAVRNGFPLPLGLALSAAYQRHAASGLEGLPVIVVDYIALTEDPRNTVTALLAGLERLGAKGRPFDLEAAIASVRPVLRRATHPPTAVDPTSIRAAIDGVDGRWPSTPVAVFDRFHLAADGPDAWEAAILDIQRNVRDEQERRRITESELADAMAAGVTAREDLDRNQAALDEASAERSALEAERSALEDDVAAARAAAGSMGSVTGRLTRSLRRLGARIPLVSRFVVDPLFDRAWYLATYQDLGRARKDPYHHYLTIGIREGRDPNPLFDTDWYLERYPDVRRSGADPLEDYRRRGVAEGRDPSPLFDTDWYLQRNPDVAASKANPLLHYLRHGGREGRQPRPGSNDQRVVSPGIENAHVPFRRLRSWRISRRVASSGLPPVLPVEDVERVLSDVDGLLPADVGVAMAGDWVGTAMTSSGRSVRAFPGGDGDTPVLGGSLSAIARLESMRADGVGVLVIPAGSAAWLGELGRFKSHLDTRYARSSGTPSSLYDLRSPMTRTSASVAAQVRAIVDEFRDRFDREPTILDWNSGIDLAVAATDCEVFAPQAGSVDRLPYLDASIDLVAVSADDASLVAEAERVARLGVIEGTSSNGVPASLRWRSEPPTVTLPSASVVIPTYNGLALVTECLRTFDETVPDYVDVEVIVVDDASTDGTREQLQAVVQRHPRASLVLNEKNLGFIGSVERGSSVARGDVLILLNNDTLLLPGWFSSLLRTFHDHPDAGVVGGRLIYPSGRLQEAGGIVFSDGSAANYGYGDADPDAPRYSYVRKVDYVSGALLATPTAIFRELGGLDPVYGFGYYEDVDYSFKLRRAGFPTYFQPQSAIVHLEGGTSGTDLDRGPKRYQAENRMLFVARWHEDLMRQPPPPSGTATGAEHAPSAAVTEGAA